MSKSLKLKNGNYIDSTLIMHNRKSVNEILESYLQYPIYYTEITGSSKNDFNNIFQAIPDTIDKAIIISGIYSVSKNGAPIGANAWGLLITIKNSTNFNSIMDAQIYIPNWTSGIYVRTMNAGIKKWQYIKPNEIVNTYETIA